MLEYETKCKILYFGGSRCLKFQIIFSETYQESLYSVLSKIEDYFRDSYSSENKIRVKVQADERYGINISFFPVDYNYDSNFKNDLRTKKELRKSISEIFEEFRVFFTATCVINIKRSMIEQLRKFSNWRDKDNTFEYFLQLILECSPDDERLFLLGSTEL